MRKYLLGGLITIVILGLFSYTTTDNEATDATKRRRVFNIPLKQQRVVTTDDIQYVNKLVKKGYIVEFVTENTNTTYTLIKY